MLSGPRLCVNLLREDSSGSATLLGKAEKSIESTLAVVGECDSLAVPEIEVVRIMLERLEPDIVAVGTMPPAVFARSADTLVVLLRCTLRTSKASARVWTLSIALEV